ncbi:MAG: hypothetical protein OER88_02065, partial [Planctomycetota bacterium]|nr:hypothetical protein [Planctomycetota bacterium]
MHELEPIRKKLDALRGKVMTALLVDGGARVAVLLLLVIAISFVLDRFFKLEFGARGVLLLAGLGALGYATWRYVVRRVKGAPGEDPLAVAVERRFPELNDRLISALQLSRVEDLEQQGMSKQLVDDAIKEAVEPVSKVRFREVLATGKVAKVACAGALALGLLAAGAAA